MLLRYPGGKAKIAPRIVRVLDGWARDAGGGVEYREPFVGGGAVALAVIRECPGIRRAWINDADPAMACLWRTVVERPGSLRLILACLEPSVDYFRLYKSHLLRIARPEDLERYDSATVAAMKVACHQMSYSGLGSKAGGPIGGMGQAGKYDVGCRFDSRRLSTKIKAARDLLASVELHPGVCTCLDFEDVIRAGGDSICYLDPPYYRAGPGLYQFAFGHDDHVRLAGALRGEGRPWLLSYDRHRVIEGLYRGWASIAEVPISYSINGAVRSSEWLISNRALGSTPP